MRSVQPPPLPPPFTTEATPKKAANTVLPPLALLAVTIFVVCSVIAIGGTYAWLLSGRAPSESSGRAALELKIQRESNGLIRLVAFHKTDGILKDVMGQKLYELHYAAEIKFLDNCYWGSGSSIMGWQGDYTADRKTGPSTMSSLMEGLGHYKDGTKGQRERVTASLYFQKTEAGWNLVR